MVQAARTSLAVTLFSLALIASALVGACSGGEFTQSGASSGGGSNDAGTMAGTGAGGGSGSTPGGTVLCAGPGDCDDLNPCTIDECGAEGSCVFTPMECPEGQRCCDGNCGTCCAQADCMDGVSCTADQCFNLFCTYVPDDGACGVDQYCHASEDCKDKEPCPNGTATECDDGDPCTEDNCSSGFCEHEYCESGLQCCPGVGCAACCGDGQCPNTDGDSCTQEVCQDGRCESGPLCTNGALCCEGADHASCADACCVPDDCDDDVECTVENCLAGECSSTANDDACPDGEVCDLSQGCVPVAMCQDDADCVSADKCQTGDCVAGICTFTGCSNNLTCCPNVGCRECCDNTQCGTEFCCGGVCQQCCTRYDCGAVSLPPAAVPVGCENRQCAEGVCTTTWDECQIGFCCAPYGCSTALCEL